MDQRAAGIGNSFPVIVYLTTPGQGYTLEHVKKDRRAPAISLMTYDELISSRRLTWGTYVFTDLDRLAYSDLELAGRIYLQLKSLGVPVINNPARVKTRYSLLRILRRSGLNDFNVYPADEAQCDLRYPVFVRHIHGHALPLSDLLYNSNDTDEVLRRQIDAGIPLRHLMIVEYAGEPVRPHLFRKLAGFRIGLQVLSYLCVHDDQWLIKRGKIGIAGDELYEEEFGIVRDNLLEEPLRKAFSLAEIEFGRADLGFYQGRLQVFEINTNPHILPPREHPSPTRVRSMDLAWNNILRAFHSLDSKPGPDITLPKDNTLNRHRKKWNRFAYRTRPVP